MTPLVVPYIGTWIETGAGSNNKYLAGVVPYIGTWIETFICGCLSLCIKSYLI